MIQYSVIKPQEIEYYFDKQKNTYLVYLRINIEQVDNRRFRYEEYKIELPYRDNFETYLNQNKQKIIEKQKELEDKKIKEREIKQRINSLIEEGKILEILEILIDNDLKMMVEIEQLKKELNSGGENQ